MAKSNLKTKIGLKQILSGILTFMLVFTSIPITGFTTFAAEEHQVNGGSSQDLINAINSASNGDSIVINGTVNVDKEIKIARMKTITLKGNGVLLRDKNFRDKMLRLDSYADLTIEGITIDGNNVKDSTGSAIYIYRNGSLTMNSGTIKNNSKDGSGSGVLNDIGTFTMNSGTITGNTASGDGGGVCSNSGTFTMNSGTITGNTASGNGGGVYSNKTFTMKGGIISENTASGHYGGGVHNSGTFKMTGGTISKNTVSYYGGGVHNSGTFKMTGGTISENKASKGSGLYLYGDTFEVSGASVIDDNANNDNVRFVSADKCITVTGKFSGSIGVKQDLDKVAVKAADGYTLTQDDADHFFADELGKCLELTNNTLVCKKLTSENIQSKIDNAKSGDTITINDRVPVEKTITINKDVTLNGKGTLIRASGFKDTILSIRSGAKVTMEDITIDGNNIAGASSAVYINSGTSFTMKSGTIKNNTARGNGGGVCNYGETFTMIGGTISGNSASAGGGLYNGGPFTMIGGEISKNTASDNGGGVYSYNDTFTMNGGTISENTTKASGGGIYNSGTFDMIKGTISGNKAESYSGGISNQSIFTMSGGAITGNSSNKESGGVGNAGTFTMTGGVISENSAEEHGGGIKNIGTLNISGGEILKNTASSKGGGVYINGGTFTIKSGIISGNNANDGGGVYGNNLIETFTMDGGTISENTAGAGGGVYYYGSFTMNSGTIKNNKAGYAGGVYNHSGKFTMNGGEIKENKSSNSSGGVYNYNDTFTMNGGVISKNTAATEGGGVYNHIGMFNMNGGVISENTAKDGGGVYNKHVGSSGSFKMTDGTITGNSASGEGSGVYNAGPFRVQDTAIIYDNDKNDNVRIASSDYPITVSGGYYGIIRLNSEFGNVVVKADDGYTMTQSDASCFKADGSDAYLNFSDNKIVYMKNRTEWGQMVHRAKATYYINENGRASTEITGNEKVWLNTKLDGSGTWYCLDNTKGTFKVGSRFYVQVIDDISKYYDKIGSEYRDKIEDGKLKIFLIGVIDPDGNEYTNLDTEINFYVKVNPDWDKDKIRAIFINGEKTEKIDIEYLGTIESPFSGDKYVRLTIKHFSPYAIYQAKSQENEAVGDNFTTGENVNYGYIVGLSTMAILALAGVIFVKKKFN